MSKLLLKIKNGVNCMGRSQEQSSLNLEAGGAMRELWLFLLKDFEILMMSSMICQSNFVMLCLIRSLPRSIHTWRPHAQVHTHHTPTV
jgi:hypothetical protein